LAADPVKLEEHARNGRIARIDPALAERNLKQPKDAKLMLMNQEFLVRGSHSRWNNSKEKPMAKSQFVYVIYIRTTREKLWEALTKPEFTRQFWCETWQDCDWKQGSSWKIMIPDGRVGDSGEVLEIVPHKRLVVSWRNEFIPELREEGYSRLSYELEQQGDTVKLTVTHEMDKDGSTLIEKISSGWPPLLSSLKSMLETGESLELTRHWPKGM
jgi:uncharacterized protein YndB with AHSA1/START domain